MYEIIQAEEKHLDQIVPLLSSTGYYDATAKNNLLNLTPQLYLRNFILQPLLPITSVLVNKNDYTDVLGMISCASKKELEHLTKPKSYVHPELQKLFANLHNFKITDSYHIHTMAITKKFRNIGLETKLLKFAESQALTNGYDTISLLDWNCQTNIIQFYLQNGFQITNSITVSELIAFPLLLNFEKNLNATHEQSNYFETEEYYNLNLLESINEKN